MWIAKFVIKHDCILGNRCEKFDISLQSINLSVFKDDNDEISSSMHYISGNFENIKKFILDLKKDKNVIKLENKGLMFFLLEKAKEKAVKHHTPKIIFIKPVLIDRKGYETWEIGSWEKEEVSVFIKKVKREIKDFNLLILKQLNIDNIFFPKLMPNLTEKQKRALDIAIDNGYYESPRKIDLRKMAKLMNVSLSTFEQHLRVAEEKLIPSIKSYSE